MQATALFIRPTTRHPGSGHGEPLDERLRQQLATADRLRAALPREAARLAGCGLLGRGLTRCSSRFCVTCETITKRAFIRRAERRVRGAREAGCRVLFVTATCGSDSVEWGLSLLRRSWSRLRRQRSWSPVQLEVVGVEVERVTREGSRLRWHVHLHAVVAVAGRRSVTAMAGEWSAAWRSMVAAGSFDLRAWRRSPTWRGQGSGAVGYVAKPWRPSLSPEGLSGPDLVELHAALWRRRLRWTAGPLARG